MKGAGVEAVRAVYFRLKLEEFILHYSLAAAVVHFGSCRQEISRWRSGKAVPRYLERRILATENALALIGSYGVKAINHLHKLATKPSDLRLQAMVAITSEVGRQWPKQKVSCTGNTLDDCVVTVGTELKIYVGTHGENATMQIDHISSRRRFVVDTAGLASLLLCLTEILDGSVVPTNDQPETPSPGA